MSVAVIIPTYNDGEFLEEALRSVAAQTVLPTEVVIVDDGSDPPPPEDIVAKHRTTGIPIQLVHQPHQGPSTARNTGLGLVSSPYVAFLDADDWWKPDFLEDKLRWISQLPEHFAGVYGSYIDTRGRKVASFMDVTGVPNPDLLGQEGGIPGGAPMYLWRRSHLISVEGFDEDLAINEDYDLIARLIRTGASFAGCAAPTYRRRYRPASLTRTDPERTFCGVARFLEKAERLSLLSNEEIQRRVKTSCLQLARHRATKDLNLAEALSLCRQAFRASPPSGAAQRVLYVASRLWPDRGFGQAP